MIARLDRYLVNSGIGSRTDVKKYIASSRVLVDGKESRPEIKIDTEKNKITFDSVLVLYEPYVYIMLNKPAGVISATVSPRGEDKTVIDILGGFYGHLDLFPVGRLDKDTVGLLIISNDGKFAHNTLSPKRHVSKTYLADIEGVVGDEDIKAFEQGVVLDDGYKCEPGKLRIIMAGGEKTLIELEISEGKFHQVKRMFESVGKKVLFLKRTGFCGISLDGTLEAGEFRKLNEREMAVISNFIS